MSLRQVAAKANVALGTVQGFEKGDYTLRLDTFLKLLAAVDLLPTAVLNMDGETAAPEALTLDQELRRLSSNKNAQLLQALATLLQKASEHR
jgi:transcriptional regulator with XRE-family HTH domain